jgi:hypothetical protein
MKTMNKAIEVKDRKGALSLLWIFAMFNYLYADVFGLYFNPILQKDVTADLLRGYVRGSQITQGFVLAFSILTETAIAMVLLSRVLNYGANRWANIWIGVLPTAAVSASLFSTTPTFFYAFFATVEIACTSFIVWFAWTWSHPSSEVPASGQSIW